MLAKRETDKNYVNAKCRCTSENGIRVTGVKADPDVGAAAADARRAARTFLTDPPPQAAAAANFPYGRLVEYGGGANSLGGQKKAVIHKANIAGTRGEANFLGGQLGECKGGGQQTIWEANLSREDFHHPVLR